MPKLNDPRIIVGTNSVDDAAVYTLNDHQALVQSVDFFTPVVDDPYQFGSIAAANSLSDIYAMGSKPIFALNIVCFPTKTLPLTILQDILKGGRDKAKEAGIPIVGGHSIDDPEPKYGLIVNGIIDKERVVTNAGAKTGDVLILTKPLGLGIINTGIKGECVTQKTIERAVKVMNTLNRSASEIMMEIGVNACTDITGFGLLGHLYEMVSASKVTASISLNKVPVLKEAWDLAKEGIVPGGTRANLKYVKDKIIWEDNFSEEEELVLADAQTSGGLLISVQKEKSQEMLDRLSKAKGVLSAVQIGEIIEGKKGMIRVKE
jgi:selenide,water dikinase